MKPDADAVLAAALALLCTGRPVPGVTAATLLDSLPELDSMRLIEAVALLEGQFGVEIDPTALEELVTVADVVAVIVQGRQVTTPPRGRQET